MYNISLGRVLNKQTPEHIMHEALEADAEGEDDTTATLHEAAQPNANSEARKRRKGRS